MKTTDKEQKSQIKAIKEKTKEITKSKKTANQYLKDSGISDFVKKQPLTKAEMALKDLTRDELFSDLTILRKKCNLIEKKIDVFDYNEKFKAASKYIGKYYKEIFKISKDYITCFYIYGININNCTLNTLRISYHTENNETYYDIEHLCYFNPDKNKDYLFSSIGKYKKITKKEFEKHYNKIQQIINNIVFNPKK